MRDPFSTTKRRRRWLRPMEIDSWIDSALFGSGGDLARAYEAVFIFMRRFHVSGFKKVVTELVSEGLTWGVVGATLALALALPAFDAIRSDWRIQSDYSVTFLDRYGNEIGKRGILHNDSPELEDLPDHLVQAVLATEDRRFFVHFGIDFIGTARAMMENARAGTIVQGGSSITQQLAKNVFLSNERTLERKIKEAYLALWLEANLSKREILKLYLDRAYMGGGSFGIAAASEFYYGKPVSDLNLAESAMLAGLFKAPTRYAPHINLPAARARANEVLTNMVQAGFMTEGQIVGARRAPANAIARDRTGSPDYFLDWAFNQVKSIVGGRDRVLTVRTSVDMRLQKAAEAAVESSLRESGEAYNVRQAALVAMEPDGTVRAMVGGRDYGASTFNRATNALRQPGSSFKPYVYATALEFGYTPASIVLDAPVSIGNWSPQNYARRYRGRVTLKTALTKSINVIPVRLSIAMGRQPIAEMAERLGVASQIRVTRSLPLGTSEVTVLDQATGYSAFSSGGYQAVPSAVVRILNSADEVIYDRAKDAAPRKRVLDQSIVIGMVDMLNNVVNNGTGRRARLPGINAGGKTGTTQAYRDAWFVGFTGNLTAAVWFGNDNFRRTRRLTGGRLPAETWQKFMRVAHSNIELKPLPGLDPIELDPSDPALLAARENDAVLIPDTGTARLAPETSGRLGNLDTRMREAAESAGAALREVRLDDARPAL
jgi:penicillin-binding protein 1A